MRGHAIRVDGGTGVQHKRVQRRDECRFDRTSLLPNGAMRVDAVVTGPGVFVYYDESGQEVREYRPPSEVNRADSLRSLRDIAVTIFHPRSLVTPSNWREHAIGHQSGDPVATSEGVRTSLVINDASGVGGIQNGDLVECSCGYELWLEDTAGVSPEGEKFDRIQRDIVYNHIALGPSNWGRQGASVSLRLDSEGNQVSGHKESTTMKIQIHFDGKMYTVEAGSQEHTDLLNKIAARQAEYDSLVKTAKELKTALDTKTGELDVLTKEHKEVKTKLDAAPAAARLEVEARIRLETKAAEVLGEGFKCDGKDDQALRVEMIQKFDPEFQYDAKTHSTDYVRAVCDTYLKRGSGDRQVKMASDAAGHTDPPVRGSSRSDTEADEIDPNDIDAVEKAQSRMRKDNRDVAKHFSAQKGV
jgi:hypothetical protein